MEKYLFGATSKFKFICKPLKILFQVKKVKLNSKKKETLEIESTRQRQAPPFLYLFFNKLLINQKNYKLTRILQNIALKMKRPGVGVGVFILNKDLNKFLMSKRKDCDRIALIGGHLERFETICECAQREVLEESNLQIPLQEYREYPSTVNAIHKEDDYHYVTFFAAAIKPENQEVLNTEPEKQEDWEWYGEEEFVKAFQQKQLFYAIEYLFKTCNEDFNILIEIIKKLLQ
ncbi:hypothetical protein ABPG72_007179 [Tetrahymena utriculariae]